jgi:hypothetical protein
LLVGPSPDLGLTMSNTYSTHILAHLKLSNDSYRKQRDDCCLERDMACNMFLWKKKKEIESMMREKFIEL